MSVEVEPWFGGDMISLEPLAGTDKVAYSWSSLSEVPDEPKTIRHLLVWHDCDKSVWRGDPKKDQALVSKYLGWHPTGVGAHTLVSADPLHIEASVYWPTCCGMHGFIRNGAWVSA